MNVCARYPFQEETQIPVKSFESIVTLRERPLSSPFIGPDMEEPQY